MIQTAKPSVIITRSEDGNKKLSMELERAGYSPISFNLLKFTAPRNWKLIDPYMKKVSLYNWLIFTSSTSISYFVRRCRTLGIDLSGSNLPRIASVGPSTAKELEKHGLIVNFVPSSFTTYSLGKELPDNYGRYVLAFRSSLGGPSLKSILEDRGFTVDEVHIYRTEFRKVRSGKKILAAEAILFGSSSAVYAFESSLASNVLVELKRKPALCIGPVTAKAAKEAGFQNVLVPAEQTFKSLLELLKVIVT